MNLSMKSHCFNILLDYEWHGCSDFVHLGLSYRNRLNELKQEGERTGRFLIESQKDGNRPTFRYRMLRVVKEAEPPLERQEDAKKSYEQPALFESPVPRSPPM